MTSEDDFHRMLAHEPGDTHTRLVYADWLDVLTAHPLKKVILTSRPEFGGDEGAAWLVGDPVSARVPWVDVIADARATKGNATTSVLRLRYGKGIAFQLPGIGPNPLADLEVLITGLALPSTSHAG